MAACSGPFSIFFLSFFPSIRALVLQALSLFLWKLMSLSRSAKAALRQAEAEGLTLLRAESNRTGYKGVSWNKRSEAKPYKAEVKRGGTKVYLGGFATAEEAALCYARIPEAQVALAAAAAPPAPPPMTAEEALRQAEAEGLTLLRSGKQQHWL